MPTVPLHQFVQLKGVRGELAFGTAIDGVHFLRDALEYSRRVGSVNKKLLVSSFGVFLLVNSSVSVAADDIEKLSEKCERHYPQACERLKAAVCKLTEQTRLANIAIANYGSQGDFLNLDAVECLTDQQLLARVATLAGEPEVRMAAALKLTDRGLLARIALFDKDDFASSAAVSKLADQALLAKIAIEALNDRARLDAAHRLDDQALLAELAVRPSNEYVRKAAISKLNDEKALASIALGDSDPVLRATAVSRMDPYDPALKRLAAFGQYANFDPVMSLARIKLATQEPPIRNRFPQIWFRAEITSSAQVYYTSEISGEEISVELNQGEGTLAKGSWRTHFPDATVANSSSFQPAEMRTDDFFLELFRAGQFTQGDLAGLTSSENPIVRSAAVAGLTDQALLARSAVNDPDIWVRRVAVERLANRETLARVAAGDPDLSVRLQAEARIRQLQDSGNPPK
jgi:uncharacterized protein YigA (DUF484 family)